MLTCDGWVWLFLSRRLTAAGSTLRFGFTGLREVCTPPILFCPFLLLSIH